MPFPDQDYETLCVVIALLEAAQTALSNSELLEDDAETLLAIQNRMNRHRLALLGNGQEKPYYVSSLRLT